MKSADDIRNILVIGNGLMGNQIACQCALYGKNVRIFVGLAEPSETVESIEKIQTDYLNMLIEKGMISRKRMKEGLGRITYHNDIERICQGIDLVSESVLESLDVKRKIWERFAPYLPTDAILTTNTSTLLPSDYADASGAPERFMAWHGHAPVFIQNYFDIMPHSGTDRTLISTMKEFSESIGLTYGVLTKETPGYLANNMLSAVFDVALHLWIHGAGSFQDIDRAWMAVRVYPIGPFGLLDKVGIRTARHVYAARKEQDNETAEIIARFDRMLAEGRSGCDVRKGFYDYPDAEFLRDDFVNRAKPLF